MEFLVNLIVIHECQTNKAWESIESNCTEIDNSVYIFEGNIDCLTDDEVKFNVIGEGAVECLGDMNTKELVELCDEIFAVDVYNTCFKKGK